MHWTLISTGLFAGKVAQPTVHIEGGNIRAVTASMSSAMHHVMKMAAIALDTDSDYILAFYLFTRKRKRKWREKTTVPFVFYRSRCVKIVTHSSATALLQCALMTRTVQLHRHDVYCPIT